MTILFQPWGYTVDEKDFDDALEAIRFDQPHATAAGPHAQSVDEYLTEQLAIARADPDGWLRTRREDARKAARRPRIRRMLREDPAMAEFTEADHAAGEKWLDAVGSGDYSGIVGMSDEWKARLHKWIERALPVLKRIASFTPVPYNFAVMGLIVFLIIIDERRLKPHEVAFILSAASSATGKANPKRSK